MEKIFPQSELGKKIAFVNGNRAINSKNLEQKKKSIKECGQLVPIIIVDGKDAQDEGLILVDCETGIIVPESEVSNYVVDIEGQHRYAAIKMLQKEDEKNNTSYAPSDIMMMYAENPKKKSIKMLLSELNRTSVIWDGKDFITGAALCNPTNEFLRYAKELAEIKSTNSKDGLPNSGYPLSTISKLCTFSSALDKAKLAECMDKGIESLPTSNIERAKQIIAVARKVGFAHKFIAHKYLIDFIIDECNARSITEVCDLIEKLIPADVDKISKVKGDNYLSEIREIVNTYKV